MILGKSFDRNSYFKPGFWSRLIFIFTVLSNIIKFLLLSVWDVCSFFGIDSI